MYAKRSTLHHRLLGAVFALVLTSSVAFAQNEYANDPFDPEIARDSWLLIGQTEQAYGVPAGLLHAMSLVETGQGLAQVAAADRQAALTRYISLSARARTASGVSPGSILPTPTATLS